jgi:hypothetical protein
MRMGHCVRIIWLAQKILDHADELGMVPDSRTILFRQDQTAKDEAAIRNAIDNVLNWLFVRNYRNILIEINNNAM